MHRTILYKRKTQIKRIKTPHPIVSLSVARVLPAEQAEQVDEVEAPDECEVEEPGFEGDQVLAEVDIPQAVVENQYEVEVDENTAEEETVVSRVSVEIQLRNHEKLLDPFPKSI
jgi:hypothetical protein